MPSAASGGAEGGSGAGGREATAALGEMDQYLKVRGRTKETTCRSSGQGCSSL